MYNLCLFLLEWNVSFPHRPALLSSLNESPDIEDGQRCTDQTKSRPSPHETPLGVRYGRPAWAPEPHPARTDPDRGIAPGLWLSGWPSPFLTPLAVLYIPPCASGQRGLSVVYGWPSHHVYLCVCLNSRIRTWTQPPMDAVSAFRLSPRPVGMGLAFPQSISAPFLSAVPLIRRPEIDRAWRRLLDARTRLEKIRTLNVHLVFLYM